MTANASAPEYLTDALKTYHEKVRTRSRSVRFCRVLLTWDGTRQTRASMEAIRADVLRIIIENWDDILEHVVTVHLPITSDSETLVRLNLSSDQFQENKANERLSVGVIRAIVNLNKVTNDFHLALAKLGRTLSILRTEPQLTPRLTAQAYRGANFVSASLLEAKWKKMSEDRKLNFVIRLIQFLYSSSGRLPTFDELYRST